MKRKPLVLSYLRFSTPEQAKGDSVRRQLAQSEEWASSRDLKIDQNLKDPGISGFTGANVTPTASLGRLLQMVKDGVVPHGSILLVESLDRLSRQDILPALSIFTTLIQAGLKIVTLADKKEYDAKSVTANPMDIMYSIMVLSRGHEESRIKSHRVMESWRAKQANASTKIVTEICPQWLRRDGNKWVFVPEAASAVRVIAKMVINGYTWKEIVHKINEQPKNFGKKNKWSRASVSSLMKKRTLIGEYQPCKRPKKGKPIAIGEPIANYYPAVLDAKTFRQVQRIMASRRLGGGNRQNQIVNIWSGKLFDVQENKIYMTYNTAGSRYISAGRLNGGGDMPLTPMFEADRALTFGLLNHLSMNELELSEDPEPLHCELSTVEARIEILSAQLADMMTDPAVVVKAIDGLQARKAAIFDKIAKTEAPPEKKHITAALRASVDITDPENRRKMKVAIGSVVEKVHLHVIREYRDHIVSAVFHLIDGSEVDWAFRICHEMRGKYAIKYDVSSML